MFNRNLNKRKKIIILKLIFYITNIILNYNKLFYKRFINIYVFN